MALQEFIATVMDILDGGQTEVIHQGDLYYQSGAVASHFGLTEET